MHRLIKVKILVFAVLCSNIMAASADPILSSFVFGEVASQHDSTRTNLLIKALNEYKDELNNKSADSIQIFKNMGLIYAELKQPYEALNYTDKYIKNTADISILNKDSYNKINDTEAYSLLKDKYLVNVNVLTIVYFIIAIIGLFFSFIINFKKESDWISNMLLGGFVAVHSLFLLDFAFYNSNLSYLYPHIFLMSTSVALLYGPLLYFYFKRITQQYKFKLWDLLHLLPVVLVLYEFIPFYLLSSDEKLKFMFGLSTIFSRRESFIFGFLLKLSSYVIYGFLIGKIYYNNKNQLAIKNNPVIAKWKRNIFYIHILFVISYVLYGASVGIIFEFDSEIINHSQVLAMSLMVLYIAQTAYLNPAVFNYKTFMLNGMGFSKYMKSGLTESLSEELKAELIKLFTVEKVYRDSNINLEALSEKLNTTRHNTSQIINEHFDMNFFELINKFRIEEAINLLEEDKYGNLNIIDIAYEVGYNNKVTFNKAFKKTTSLTPTQFIDSLKSA